MMASDDYDNYAYAKDLARKLQQKIVQELQGHVTDSAYAYRE
jgi:hypothetical protein